MGGWQDKVNGLFELLGGLFIMLTCMKLYRDKKVRGISLEAGFSRQWHILSGFQ